jgi:UDP-N-acetylglucosamine 4-epimerase
MEKILVTGGAGFIGSNLCEHLVLNGYDVVCLDNFSTGHMSNIQHLIDSYPLNFKLIEGDIRNFETCVRAVNEFNMFFMKQHLEAYQEVSMIQ